MWSKLDNQSKISPSSVLGGKLLLRNVKANDSGTYRCSAANILGQAQAQVQLTVNGMFVYFVSFCFSFFFFNPSIFFIFHPILIDLLFPQLRYSFFNRKTRLSKLTTYLDSLFSANRNEQKY